MNKDKDYHGDYDNFDYQNYYDNFNERLTRGPRLEEGATTLPHGATLVLLKIEVL